MQISKRPNETSWTIFAYANLDWLCDQIMYVCVLYLFLLILPYLYIYDIPGDIELAF